jgi:hypothetical protein
VFCLLSSSVIAATTACAFNAKSSYFVDCENAGRSSPVYFLSCSRVRLVGEEQTCNENVLIALPSDVANTHRSHDGLPVPVKFVWREKLHEGTLRHSFHKHRIREVVTKHTQHNLSNRKTTINLASL